MSQNAPKSVSRADTRQFVDAHTKFTDSLLEELAQLSSEQNINFNNTNQFDKLLFHLEATLSAPVFFSAPSEIILQLLFTLTARCPASNWSHDPTHGYAGDTSEYLRSVNRDYDNCLYKPSLQERSHEILQRYVHLVDSGIDSLAIQTLKANLRAVLVTFLRTGITSLFLRHKPTAEEYFRARPSPKNPSQIPTQVDGQGDTQADNSGAEQAPTAVEIISDSEDSEFVMDVSMSPEIALKMYSPDMTTKAVASLSDLSLKTSGMGEAAALFQNMPHLQAAPDIDSTTDSNSESMGNPEPAKNPETKKLHGNSKKSDSKKPDFKKPLDPESAPSSPERKDKKQKTAAAPWTRIQAFDDFMISKKLSSSTNYDIWALLHWTLVCADTSSEYQRFLFNSSSTHVHNIYRANGDFLGVFFDFCHFDLRESAAKGHSRSAVIARLVSGLGARNIWHERAVARTFYGLGIRGNNPPHPCYHRELMLTQTDPVVMNSRCKIVCENDDNNHTMSLRVHLLFLLIHYETLSSLSQTQTQAKGPDALSNMVNEGLSSLVAQVVRRLSMISLGYLKTFLLQLQRELSSDAAKAVAQTLSNTTSKVIRLADLDAHICIGLLGIVTDITYVMDTDALESQVEDFIVDPRAYRSVVDDERFQCAEDFVGKWEKLMFLLEWLFSWSLGETARQELKDGGVASRFMTILQKAQRADELASKSYAEYIESRYEDSDILLYTNFSLTRAEVDKWMARRRCGFYLMAKLQLGIR